MSTNPIRIDRGLALKEAAAILLRTQRASLPTNVIDSHVAVAQAWTAVAAALGGDHLELDPSTIGEVKW